MAAESRIITSVGYTLAAVSLCSLIVAPVGQAFAADSSSGSVPSAAEQESAQGNTVIASSKSETVNVSTKADGTVKSVEVSTTLETDGNRDIADVSRLSDLKPDEDDVYFTNEGGLVWHSPKGEAVSYKGTSTEQLPIEVRITYRLDGVALSPDELAGKSGHVVIRYDYINNSWSNGGGFAVYTPFVAITGMLLDADVFSNVKVTNGKLIEDGDRTIAVGYAMPGLGRSLDMGSDIEIPDHFEVEADVVDFELKSTLTMVSPDMLEGIDTSDLNTDEYSDASKDLTDAMNQLIDGSGALTEGLGKLSEGVKQLADGTAELDAGMSAAVLELPALEQGVVQLHSGSSQLVMLSKALLQGLTGVKSSVALTQQGAGKLATGLSDVKSKVALSQQGAEQLAAGLSDVKSSVALSQQGAAQLADGLSGDKVKALATVLGAAAQELAADAAIVEAINSQSDIVVADAAAASGAVTAYYGSIDAVAGLTEEQKAALKASLSEVESSVAQVNADAQALRDADKQLSAQAVGQAAGALQMADFHQLSAAATQLADGLQAIVDQGFGTEGQQQSLIGGATQLAGGLQAIVDQGFGTEEQQQSLIGAAKQLEGGLQAIVDQGFGTDQQQQSLLGAATLMRDGVGSLDEGLSIFETQSGEIVSGFSKIASGVSQLAIGAKQLSEGTTGAVDGSGELTDGLKTFNDEGISKIVDSIDNKLVKLGTRFKEVVKASGSYKNFAGIADGTAGTVKFVFETDAIDL